MRKLWASIIALGMPVWAHASPMAICDDILRLGDEAQSSVEDVAAYVRRDARRYDLRVAECLCALDAHVSVQQEARRHALRDAIDPEADVQTVYTADPLTSASYQVATILGRRLEASLPSTQPLVLYATREESPDWFRFDAFSTMLVTSEVQGSEPASARLAEYGFADPLPRGALATLHADGSLEKLPLHRIRGRFPRFLWLDLNQADGKDALQLQWVVHDLTQGVPLKELTSEQIRFEPSALPLVPGCVNPAEVRTQWLQRRRWPPSRLATLLVGAAVGLGFGTASVVEYVNFQNTPETDPARADQITRNVAFGAVGLAGGAAVVVGAAIPTKVWRR